MAGEYDQSEQDAKAAQELIKRKLIDGDTNTGGKKGKTGTGGTKKDVFTENLRKQYEQLKKAIQSYNDLIKSMGGWAKLVPVQVTVTSVMMARKRALITTSPIANNLIVTGKQIGRASCRERV